MRGGRVAISATILLVVVPGPVPAQTGASRPSRPGTYQSAAIDANGNLAIVTTNGGTVTLRKEGEQRSFSVPVLSASKAAVGAQAMFANCCTSYDIPLQLVIYAAG